jgi:hypothetical protein
MSVKRPKRKKLSKRVPAALVRWMKKQNPAMKRAAGVRVHRLKGGAIKITPLKNPAAGYWEVTETRRGPHGRYRNTHYVHAGSRAEALKIARKDYGTTDESGSRITWTVKRSPTTR